MAAKLPEHSDRYFLIDAVSSDLTTDTFCSRLCSLRRFDFALTHQKEFPVDLSGEGRGIFHLPQSSGKFDEERVSFDTSFR